MRIGVDVGSVRIGVARSNDTGTLAIPLETVRRVHGGADIGRLAALVREHNAIEVVVGLPLHLGGAEGASAEEARKFANRLKKRVRKVRVALIDERLSSSQAHGRLAEAGLSQRAQRDIVDQVAAQVILEQALAEERTTGRPPGEQVLSPEERKLSE